MQFQKNRNYIQENGRRCSLIEGDISNSDFCTSAIEKVINEYGEMDILVNNSAVQYECKDLKQITDFQFDKTIKTNIYGTFYMRREALKYMKSGECIINKSSVTDMQVMKS